MIAAILWRQEEQPAAAGSTFTDVASQMYYAEAIAWAERNGIVNGVSETEFAPDRAIAREELAAILYRYAAYKGYDVTASADLSSFTDAGTISPYAVDAMQWAGAEEIIQGVTTTTAGAPGQRHPRPSGHHADAVSREPRGVTTTQSQRAPAGRPLLVGGAGDWPPGREFSLQCGAGVVYNTHMPPNKGSVRHETNPP